MTTNAIIIFIVFNVLNVVIQTIKSIATIKCGKNMAAIINAIAYGLYTYIVVLTASDGVSLWFKIVVVALANLVGVWVVKFVEEKGRKDKLWKVEATVTPIDIANVQLELDKLNISHNCFRTSGEYRVFNIFCPTQKESAQVKTILDKYHAKYFVSESKTL
jgi:uncharacterized protein YebE (UPF0316 family)